VDPSRAVDETRLGRGLGWGLALLGPAAATGLGLLLAPLPEPPLLPPFLVAIAAAAVVGGVGPGLFAVLLSGLAVNYWFFPPAQSLGFASQADVIAQLVFWASSLLVVALCAWSRLWRLRAEAVVGALGAATRANQEQMAHMRLALDRAALDEAVREQTARERTALADAAREERRREEESLARREATRERTVLVADDDADARQLACHVLESAGFRWLSACDGTEALELLDRYDFPVEVGLLEAVLPDMSGQSLADQVAARYPSVAVLYTSAALSEELVEQGLLRPGDPLVRKPFTAEGLLRAVRAMSERLGAPMASNGVAASRQER
jgi:CheY-like chemotaxis protein